MSRLGIRVPPSAPEVFIMKHYTAKDIRVLSSLYRLSTSKCKLIFKMADDKFHAEQLAKLYYNGKTIEEIMAMLIYETRERIDRPSVTRYIPKEKWGNKLGNGYCENCGTELWPSANYCPQCGFLIYHPKEEENN